MAKSGAATVPKFGDWDESPMPYTIVFENARGQKAGGGQMGNKRIDPNDPNLYFGGGDDSAHSNDMGGDRRATKDSERAHPPSSAWPEDRKSKRGPPPPLPSARNNPPPPPAQLKTGNTAGGKLPTVPKFGDWNNHPPEADGGYTLIFENAREERKGGAVVGGGKPGGARPSTASATPSHHRNKLNNSSSTHNCFSVLGCCFAPRD